MTDHLVRLRRAVVSAIEAGRGVKVVRVEDLNRLLNEREAFVGACTQAVRNTDALLAERSRLVALLAEAETGLTEIADGRRGSKDPCGDGDTYLRDGSEGPRFQNIALGTLSRIKQIREQNSSETERSARAGREANCNGPARPNIEDETP